MAGKPETLYQKIVDTHTVKRIDDSTILLYVDIHFANEYTRFLRLLQDWLSAVSAYCLLTPISAW